MFPWPTRNSSNQHARYLNACASYRMTVHVDHFQVTSNVNNGIFQNLAFTTCTFWNYRLCNNFSNWLVSACKTRKAQCIKIALRNNLWTATGYTFQIKFLKNPRTSATFENPISTTIQLCNKSWFIMQLLLEVSVTSSASNYITHVSRK